MSNSPFSIRFRLDQRKWLREYATARDISEADALRELVDERMSDKPRDRATLISELERYSAAFMDLAHASGVASEMFAAGTAQAVNRLKDPEGLDRLKAVGE